MAEYRTLMVIPTLLPAAEFHGLEADLLRQMFAVAPARGAPDRLYLSCDTETRCAVLDAAAVAALLEQTPEHPGKDAFLAALRQAVTDAPDMQSEVCLEDYDEEVWQAALQRLVARSTTFTEVALLYANTCSKMTPDGFGGGALLIRATEIWTCDAQQRLRQKQAEAAKPG